MNTQTGALLHQAHMTTIEALQSLDELLGSNKKAPAMDDLLGRKLKQLSGILRSEVESHFAFEENHLFKVFINQGETGIVTMLTHEHQSILPLALQVADLALAASSAGFTDASWGEFKDAGAELVEREIFHIQKEEMGLLAAISAMVDPEIDEELADIYRREVG
ncbi:hemerythrin [Paramagnetospirillum marisnigri]|uniref:Hemerythrin n=1 Tax=Paramagnetospirillum marisnigri TaxID=1285242 RepID=A0A178MXN4_9PROT|nr:hemerythrin domain-containing protein [Paramagnetospirillum marisnigri]OAN54095.1 hemerythrin [Paramagnetospirillum marisnigri]